VTEACEYEDRECILALIERLKQIAVEGKIQQCVDWIVDFIESGEKLVAFTWHKKTIRTLLENELIKSVSVVADGSTSADKKQENIELFDKDKNVRLFIGNVQTIGTGVDGLQNACSNCAFLELPWTPGEVEQAIDRVHRMGQKDGTTAYFLIADETIESSICKLLDKKSKVLAKVLDGEEVGQS